MARKEYVLSHGFDASTAVGILKPYLEQLVKKYDLKLEEVSPTEFELSRSGVLASVRVEDRRAVAVVELSFLLEKLARGPMERILEEKVKPELQKIQA